jgi:glycosyltransferase involved in cell wall biosynthesis
MTELSHSAATSDVVVAASSRRPLRIVFFCWSYFPAPAGGAERQARLQAEELTGRGHVVEVVCPRVDGHRSGDVGGVRVHRLWRLERRHLQRITYLLSILFFGLRHLRRFDVVHVHLANLQADVVVPLARLLGRPTYVKVACGGAAGEVHRLARVARVTRWVGLRSATAVQALSSEIVAELGAIDVRPDRVVAIPNGFQASEFVPAAAPERRAARHDLGLPEEDTIVLYVGRFAAYKGLHDLVAVWPRVRRPNHTLVLVGAGPTDRSIAPIEEAPGLVVRDWTNDVLPYLRAADVFVYPSYADGMSNALLEAMACGLACVASRSGAAASMVADGESGLLFDAGDRDALASALSSLCDDANRRARIGAAAHLASKRFDIANVVDEIEQQYRRLARQ